MISTNRNFRRLCVAAAWFCLTSAAGAAELRFASVFSDDMVLQREKPIHIWGESAADAKVEVTLGETHETAAADADGHWQVTLKPLPASNKPAMLHASSDGKEATVRDVLVGDVWLCAGQSNMQMTLRETDGAEAAAREAGKWTSLRLLTLPKWPADKPKTDFDAKWRRNTPESAASFAAVGFHFGRGLLDDPTIADVPIGLIDSSFGGTTAEGWTSIEALAPIPPADRLVSMFGIAPSHLYNRMVAPLTPFSIKGVVWYQGESNGSRPDLYARVLSNMIADWRTRWNDADLPVLLVQLPAFTDSKFIWIREAQAEVARTTPHVSIAVTTDTTDGFDLHPKQKAEIGRRLALLARRDVYGRHIVAAGPLFKEAKVDGATMRVAFDAGGDGLTAASGQVKGFAVAGEDGVYHYADATIDGDAVVLRSNAVPSPKTARYAWAGIPEANLTNRSGLPAAPFRTDAQPRSEGEVQKQAVTRRFATPVYELQVDGVGKVTSLVVRGKQFLSNEAGAAGGTSVPAWLGARSLADIRELGPNLLSCGDSDITLTLSFKDDAMEWTLANRGKDDLQFRIALAGQVKVDHADGNGPTTLSRGDSILAVTGVDSVSKTEDGNMLVANLKGGATKRLALTITERPK